LGKRAQDLRRCLWTGTISGMTGAILHDHVALITGGSRGIGRGIALALARAGADIAINYRRDEDAALATVDKITAMGRHARAYAASVSEADQCEAMVAQVARDFGRIDILVNNAGIASSGSAVADTPADELTRVMAVHALAPHWLCRAALPHLRLQERSDVVMISSVATDSYAANGAPYSMGKAAMEALAFTLAKEEMPNGVRVHVVKPSLTVSDMGWPRQSAASLTFTSLTQAFRLGACRRQTMWRQWWRGWSATPTPMYRDRQLQWMDQAEGSDDEGKCLAGCGRAHGRYHANIRHDRCGHERRCIPRRAGCIRSRRRRNNLN
jgi:3-oxoacyl-[acyl-carrier protein] reductase